MKLNCAGVALVGLAVLGGCSSLESSNVEYKSAGKLPSLEVPPDLTRPGQDGRYAVPESKPKGAATFSEYAVERTTPAANAGETALLPSVDGMRIERAGTQRWLVVTGSPEKLWPQLKDFWQNTGFTIKTELPEAGVMETDWAENRAKIPQGIIRDTLGFLYSTPERDKFRTRIEQGAAPNTTEVYISHRGMYEIYINEEHTDTRWQPRPADPDLEAEMLRRLMVRLGATEEKAKSVLAGTAIEERARLLPDGSGLLLSEPFDRAWRRVGLALDRVGFTVEDRDRANGFYFVRYIDPEGDVKAGGEEEGFFSKLAFWRDKPDAQANPQQRIFVKASGDGSVVEVMTADGKPDGSSVGKKILKLLHDQLK